MAAYTTCMKCNLAYSAGQQCVVCHSSAHLQPRNWNDVCRNCHAEWASHTPGDTCLGGRGMYIPPNSIVADLTATVPSTGHSGAHCAVKMCNTYNDFAEPNQPDGTHICYSCRQSGRTA